MNLKTFVQQANWFMVFYLGINHLVALIAIPFLFDAKWQTLAWFPVWYAISGVGITGGAHRLWAHRSYKAGLPVRIFLMLANSTANQGSIYHWVRDHRVHHKFSETDADPHDATRGFFYAHVGWLLVKKSPKVIEAGKKLDFKDLEDDGVVMFQNKLDPMINMLMCFFAPTIFGVYICGDSWLNSFLILGILRYVVVLNATWMVNSVAHKYGYKPYDPEINPAENFWVALAAIGEGWHNWHHKYPSDYATSEMGFFKRFNPTKLFIDTCALFGLVWDRQRSISTWKIAKAKMEQNKLSENLSTPVFAN